MERIGRYAVERALGSGAFGTVWLARDETIDSHVAIKVLAENWVQNDAVRQRFTEEARILFQIESDHIVRVHGVDELPDGRPYFVMEYADRGSLEDRVAERFAGGGWFTVDEALALSRDIALGLKVAHAFGIAHRDLKPANVMFRSIPAHLGAGTDERLVLVDFGVAKSLVAGGSTTIATGTPHYMAPEQSE
ncbi:MAG: eukaryotic-like serine/threonine-protein kinase, partial [Acidimicrobiaceae bacterium]